MKEYIQENRERFFEELFSLLRIPSISAKQDHKKDMERCAERLKELLLEAGADEAGVYPSKGNPVVFGKKIINPEWKTVMVYGHYDVQPPEPLEKWHTDPFEPVIKQDRPVRRPSMPVEPTMTKVNSLCTSRLLNISFVAASFAIT